MIFYLGTHMPHWLNDSTVPLFVSHRRLMRTKKLPKATHRWALDSGGFTELSMFGGWKTSPQEYVRAVERYALLIGRLDWAAPQDWMCEPVMLAKTGLTVLDHQRLTVANYVELLDRSDCGHFIPVLQGWQIDDYQRHVQMYGEAGVNLALEHRVGIGSVCRRQYTAEIGEIVESLSHLRLHGFGVKTAGVRRYGHQLASSDSMSWSYRGRKVKPCPHTGVTSCANCRPHALEWRSNIMRSLVS